jgi:Ulp1 family protease
MNDCGVYASYFVYQMLASRSTKNVNNMKFKVMPDEITRFRKFMREAIMSDGSSLKILL